MLLEIENFFSAALAWVADLDLEFHDLYSTTILWLLGLTAGSIAALLLCGALIFVARLTPVMTVFANFFRAIPILALSPLFVWLFGVDYYTKLLLISWACFFPVFIATLGAIKEPRHDLELRMRAQRMGRWRIIRYYDVPRMIIGFLTGIELSVGIGWLTVVAAEIVANPNFGFFRGGIGQWTYLKLQNSDSSGYIGLIIFGILGIISAQLWRSTSKIILNKLRLDSGRLG